MGLSDLVHSLVVLASVGSYALPLAEGVQRKSRFYTVLFGSLIGLSFALHCEETGICDAFPHDTHARLRALSVGVSWWLAGIMGLVVLEIRQEVLGRLLTGLWAAAVVALRGPDDPRFAGVGTVLLVGLVFAVDVVAFKRRFSGAFWKRLALIGAMVAVGAGVFRLIHAGYRWHGIYHIYLSAVVYLLLLAQRHKRGQAAAGRGGPHRRVSAVTSGVVGGLTTPSKRRAGSGGGASPGGTGGGGASAMTLDDDSAVDDGRGGTSA